jgi:hypothetical protein
MIPRRSDLLATALLAAASTGVLVGDLGPAALRVTAGLLLLLVLPGYALGRALFGERSLGGPERVLVSLALSTAVAIFDTLLVNASSLALTRHTWAATLGGVTIVGCLIASIGADVKPRMGRLTLPRVRDIALLAAAIAITSGAIALGRTPLDAPDGVTGYTELWLTPRDGRFELGVASEELGPATYRLILVADGRVVRQWSRIGLNTGGRWVKELPAGVGRSTGSLNAYLYKLDHPKTVYRRVRVSPGASASGP